MPRIEISILENPSVFKHFHFEYCQFNTNFVKYSCYGLIAPLIIAVVRFKRWTIQFWSKVKLKNILLLLLIQAYWLDQVLSDHQTEGLVVISNTYIIWKWPIPHTKTFFWNEVAKVQDFQRNDENKLFRYFDQELYTTITINHYHQDKRKSRSFRSGRDWSVRTRIEIFSSAEKCVKWNHFCEYVLTNRSLSQNPIFIF